MSRLDADISRYGDFCAHDDNNDDNKNDTIDYFTPCACVRGNDKHHLFYILFKAAEHAGSSNQSIHIRLVQS